MTEDAVAKTFEALQVQLKFLRSTLETLAVVRAIERSRSADDDKVVLRTLDTLLRRRRT